MLAREFREQPTAQLARETQRGITMAISPNERLQHRLHPWTSYAIVPLFALANAGTHISADILSRAATSPITLGIIVAYVVGKPLGILAASWLATRRWFGGLRLPVGWPNLFGGGAVAGIGFTVSLLVATLAFERRAADRGEARHPRCGDRRDRWSAPSYFTALKRLPAEARARLALGRAEAIVDLALPVDPERDHVRGPEDAPVTLVEYGDFECPYCGRAEPVLRELLADFGDELRFVFRDLPLSDVHPRAQLAAEASEAAGAQGKFWEMHDLLFDHQDALAPQDLSATRRSSASTSTASATSYAAVSTRRASPRTSRARTRATSRARRRSSSTGSAITARTTRRAWRRRCARPGLAGCLVSAFWEAASRFAVDQGRQATSRSFWASARARSFFSVWCSIWRMRSRVTLNARPTSSSVSGARPSSP